MEVYFLDLDLFWRQRKVAVTERSKWKLTNNKFHRAQEAVWVPIAMAQKGMMWLAPRPTAFDSLLCKYPSQLGELVAHQKVQAWSWIWTSIDAQHGSLVPWQLVVLYSILRAWTKLMNMNLRWKYHSTQLKHIVFCR